MKKIFLALFCHLAAIISFAQLREIHTAGDLNNDIKGVSFLTPSTGFLAFTNYIAFTQDSGHTYVQRPITLANTNFNGYTVNVTLGFVPSGVWAFSADSLITYGHYFAEPSILFSGDQGLTWKLVYHENLPVSNPDIYNRIFDMKFYGNTGIATQHDKIVRSTNRGQSWTVYGYGSKIEKLNFVTPSVGFATAGYNLMKTTNGGITWSLSNVPVSNSSLNYNNVFFVNTSLGYITESSTRKIYRTVNGGVSWINVNNVTVNPVDGSDLFFINDSTGFLCKEFQYQVYKTTDSGKTWEPCKKDIQYQYLGYGFNRMHFLNAQTGWFAGAGEYLMLSTGGTPIYPKAFFKIDTTRLNYGAVVNLTNLSKPNYQYKWYKNDVLIATSYNTSYTHLGYPLTDTIKLVVDNGVNTDTSTLMQSFIAPGTPVVITNVSPLSGNKLSFINITGSGFTGISGVSFGGVPMFSMQIFNDNNMRVMVGVTGASGDITVQKPNTLPAVFPGFIFYPTPAVISSSPSAAQAGATVTVNGSNFVAAPSVYFGSVKASVISATSNQINVTVPPGAMYGPVSVITNTLTAFSPNPFTPVYSNGAINTGSFSPALVLPTQTAPKNIAVADFDGDGKSDFVTANRVSNSITIYRNTNSNGIIGFDAPITLATSGGTYGTSRVIAGDVDGDGKLDIIETHLNGTSWSNFDVFINTSTSGNISFAAKQSFSTSTKFYVDNAESIASDDFDGDGKIDFVIANLYDKQIALLLNKSSASQIGFVEYYISSNGEKPTCVALKDIDGDQIPDLVAGIRNKILVFRNVRNYPNSVQFAPVVTISGPDNPQHLSFADLDNDGKTEMIVSDFTGGNLFLYRNLSAAGNIAFAAHTDLATGTNPNTTAVDDIDGDGKIDIAVSNTGSNTISLFKNNSTAGTLSFNPKIDYPAGNGPEGIAITDLNGDNEAELVIANTAANTVSILRKTLGQGLTLCPQTNSSSVTENTSGTVYQWQLDTGLGFSNLSNNPSYSGTATNTLQLNGISNNWYGYKFRCVTDAVPGAAFVLKFANTWTGAISNLWTDAGNWSCGVVPQLTTDVYINSGTVLLPSSTTIGSLHLGAGVNFTVNTGAILTITH